MHQISHLFKAEFIFGFVFIINSLVIAYKVCKISFAVFSLDLLKIIARLKSLFLTSVTVSGT
jgi:hypothetical protein